MISVEIKNPAEVADLLEKLSAKVGLKGLSLVMRSFGQDLVNSVQRNFDEEGRPEKWKPLKPATIRAWLMKRKSWISRGRKPFSTAMIGGVGIPLTRSGKAAYSGVEGQSGRKILTDTARLRRSIHSVLINKFTVAVRAGTEYAATHQFGVPGRNAPARPFLLVQDEDWVNFREQVRLYLEKL